jgi:hypothetical protein
MEEEIKKLVAVNSWFISLQVLNGGQMTNRLAGVILLVSIPLYALAQDNNASTENSGEAKPEEIEVIGQRSLIQLRLQMEDAEKAAYDIFNRFNDERRFEINCSTQQPTGTRFLTQICLPNFQHEAMSAQGQAFLQDFRNLYLQNECQTCPVISGSTASVPVPVEAATAAHQKAYKLKMEQVAKEHPEFLEAIIEYSRAKLRFQEARGMAEE